MHSSARAESAARLELRCLDCVGTLHGTAVLSLISLTPGCAIHSQTRACGGSMDVITAASGRPPCMQQQQG